MSKRKVGNVSPTVVVVGDILAIFFSHKHTGVRGGFKTHELVNQLFLAVSTNWKRFPVL